MAIVYVLLCELYILSDKICWKVTFCHSDLIESYIFATQNLQIYKFHIPVVTSARLKLRAYPD